MLALWFNFNIALLVMRNKDNKGHEDSLSVLLTVLHKKMKTAT